MRGKNHWLKLHIWASVREKHTLCLHKDYPVSAALGWRWNRLLNVQMFHVLSWGSVICWILCFSLPHPVIPRSPYHWVFLLCLTFVPLASYCCSGTEDPGRSKGYGCSLPLKSSFGSRSAGFMRKGAFEMQRHGGRCTASDVYHL